MGYRINLSNVNSIGHLIEGNVYSFLDQTFLDDNYFIGNLNYIDDFLSENNMDFISSNKFDLEKSIQILRDEWRKIKPLMEKTHFLINTEELLWTQSKSNSEIINFISKISNFLNSYKYKFLLLPGFTNNKLNNSLIDRKVLINLLNINSNPSYLIIQLKELPDKNDIQILDSFEYMNLAIERIDEWPAILIWQKVGRGKSKSVLIPINGIEEVVQIIDAQNHEKQYFSYLRKTYGSRKTKHITQFIHLSDLHLGANRNGGNVLRLIEILKSHRRSTDSQVQMHTIISGDIVDSPSKKNIELYNSFKSQLDSIGLFDPIIVLGNHDLFYNGYIRTAQTKKNVLMSLTTSDPVTVFDDFKLILIQFNSNIDGQWAQGKIGKDQLSNVGNRLDRIIGKDDYFKIAILHHHPFEIERPDWIKKTWYESILGKMNFDVDKSNILIDAKMFIDWLKARDIKFVVHGHKHIPKLFKINGINIVAGGSSSGNIMHANKERTFLTYNIIKYDLDLFRPISSTIVFEDLIGSGTKNYQVEIY